MSFPWIFEAKVDANQATPWGWDSESDTGSLLDAPHYTELARLPWSRCAPYRGAYCWRVQMGDTNDHTLLEGDIDIAADARRWASFYLYLAPNVVASADDTWNIFELQSAGPVVEGVIGLRITAATDAVEIGVGETAPTAFGAATLEKNRWYHIELDADLDDGGSNDGSLTLYVDGVNVATVGSLDQAAVVQGVLGTQDTLATTTGTLLLDWFRFDDTQISPERHPFGAQMTFSQSCHAFVGPGVVTWAALLTSGASNIMRLYDTDTGSVADAQGFVAELDLSAQTTIEGPLYFRRGCFVQMSGTDPRGALQLAPDDPLGAPYRSPAGMRLYALRRKERAGNV